MLWACNFETTDGSSTLCTVETGMRSAFHWTLWSGPTPSVDTGPSKAFNGHYYIYVEASRPSIQGDMAEYVCQCKH